MGLIPRENHPTNFVLPVRLVGTYVVYNRYYKDEKILFKAYYQLKKLNIAIKPFYPIVYDDDIVI